MIYIQAEIYLSVLNKFFAKSFLQIAKYHKITYCIVEHYKIHIAIANEGART